MNRPPRVACPTCSTVGPYLPTNPFRPFCSERCKLIDLGAWAEERYRIAGANAGAPPPEDGDTERGPAVN